jgi:single-stranded DNA-binding protein
MAQDRRLGQAGRDCPAISKKGSLIFIEGRRQSREWQDKEGQKRTSFEIVATNFRMLGGPWRTARRAEAALLAVDHALRNTISQAWAKILAGVGGRERPGNFDDDIPSSEWRRTQVVRLLALGVFVLHPSCG